MSLMTSRQPKNYRWQKGDLISAKEACELLGYKSRNALQIPERRARLVREFETYGCRLTLDIWVCGGQRFLRSEIDEFITAKIEAAQKSQNRRQRGLRIAA